MASWKLGAEEGRALADPFGLSVDVASCGWAHAASTLQQKSRRYTLQGS